MVYRTAKKIVIAVIGGTLVLIGIAGWILPILPGWPLFFVGLAVLGTEFIWARRLLKKVKSAAQGLVDKVKGKTQEPPQVETIKSSCDDALPPGAMRAGSIQESGT